MDARLKLRHLRIFLEIAEAGTATGAGERLNIAQPAVSRSLRELEQIVGRPLFERTAKGLFRTPAGDDLHRFAAAALSQIQEGMTRAAGAGPGAAVRIGALPNLLASLLPEVVEQFKTEAPETDFRIEAGSIDRLLGLLRRGEIDFVIGRMGEPSAMQGLAFEYLWEEELPFAARANHPLASRAKIRLRELDRFTVIIPVPGTVIRNELDRALAEQGVNGFSNVVETISVEFGRRLVQRTDAVFVFPANALSDDLESSRIVRLDLEIEPIRSPVGITSDPLTPPSGPSIRVLEMLRAAAATVVQPA